MSVTSDPVPTLPDQTPPPIMQVGDKRVYDNFDQYAFFELQLDDSTRKTLNGQDMFELEEWINETTKRSINFATKNEAEPDWNHWQRCLGWFPMDVIKKTAKCTTNYAIMEDRGTLKRHRKSRHPQLNRKRLMEKYATDTWFASVKAKTGESCAQIFVGMKSYFTSVIGMKTESEGPSALKSFIRQVGAPFSLRNDNSKMQTGKAFMDICSFYNIGTETTEPHHPEQNPAENRIGTLKTTINRLMDRTGCPDNLCLRAAIYVSMLLNVIAHRQLAWRTPYEVGRGVTPDISPFLQFEWYEPVYYLDEFHSGFPKPKEKLGRWLGPTENCGDAMTFWILTDDTNKIIARSSVRTAVIDVDGEAKNTPVNLRLILDPDTEISQDPTDLLADPSQLKGSEIKKEKKEEEPQYGDPRFVSLSDEIRKLQEEEEGKTSDKLGMSIDPTDMLGYKFANEKDGVT